MYNLVVKKEILIIVLLLLISFPAVKSLLLPGGFTSHDLTHHVIRQISMDKLLSEGQFPPRWSGDLNNGYGYPVFVFNYPLPAIVGEGFHKLGLGFVDSVKAVLFMSMIISILGMYLFLKSLLKDTMASFLGAVFYLYAPLRFLNVYVSAAVGSALALGILPFVFWSMVKIKKSLESRVKSQGWVLIGGLFFALLILAHNVTALIFAPVILGFSGLLIFASKDRLRLIRQIGLMFLLGLGLSAWFWLPALAEKQYIRFDDVYSGFYKDQFITLWQLLRSPWGYGLSHPGSPEPGDMSYQLGLVQIGIMLLLTGSLWFFRKIREFRVIGGIVLALFAFSVFLMLKISLPVWEKLPFLSLVQFPLRFQAVAIFSAAMGAALLVKYLPFKKLAVFSLLLLVIYANRNHWNINQKFDPGDEYYLNLKTTSTTHAEHLPKWGRVMPRGSPAKVEIVRGVGEVSPSASLRVKVIRDQSAGVLAEVEASQPVKLRLNQFYFPGWEIRIDGKLVEFNYLTDPDLIGAEGESFGLPVFDMDKGKHLVQAEFKNTPVRNMADSISIITVIIVIVIIIIFNICRLSRRNL